MSPSSIPSWAQKTLILSLLISGAALVIIPQIDVPHPGIYTPEESAQRILRVDQLRRWSVAQSYGALSAEQLTLSEIRERADALPEGLQTPYYDGAAHHQRFDFEELDAWLQNIDDHIPASQQRFFHDGVMRLFARNHGADPQRVMDFSTELSNKTRTQDLSNGIRRGLQEEFGDDMREAVQIALTYPTDLYYPLLEELGWRLGYDHGANPKYWREHESILPEKTACWLAEGISRGATIEMLEADEIWWPEILEFRNELPQECGPEVASGIAEALLTVLGDNPDSLQKQLEQVESEDDREMVVNILDAKQMPTDEDKLEALPNADPDLPPLQ